MSLAFLNSKTNVALLKSVKKPQWVFITYFTIVKNNRNLTNNVDNLISNFTKYSFIPPR